MLKPKGRFIELGKTDIREQSAIESSWPGVQYLVADLTPFFAERAPWIRERLTALMGDIAAGELPRLPVKTFETADVKHAFRYMAAARHIGRVVVREGTRDLARGTHLITGGLRGIGLKLADWLVKQGARSLVLLGRQHPSSTALETIGRMEAEGATVRIVEGDIADYQTALRAVEVAGANLCGVWHCAGVLEDGALGSQSWERFAPVMRPKADGAWNLHTLTRGIDLEVFVLFSSWASLAGSRGQANYCAANAFLDGLAAFRSASGLPALSVNWGAWAETGLAAGQAMQKQLARAGMEPMQPEDALAALEIALHTGRPQLAIAAIQWPKYLSQVKNGLLYSQLISQTESGDALYGTSSRAQAKNQPQRSATSALAEINALPVAGRRAGLLRVFEEQVRKTLDLRSSDEIDPDESLSELGMDSLLAVELRNSFSTVLARRLPSTLLFDYPTLRTLARFIEQEIFPASQPDQAHFQAETIKAAAPLKHRTAALRDGPVSILDEIEQLSDEEVDALFEKSAQR